MHSSWIAASIGVPTDGRQIAHLYKFRARSTSGDRIAVVHALTGQRTPHGGDSLRPERGKSDGQGLRTRRRAGVVPSRRSGDRVRHVRLDAGLRGDRHRGRRRGRLGVFSLMLWGKGGVSRPPLLVLMLIVWASAVGSASAGEGTYRRPLGNDPATLDPAR